MDVQLHGDICHKVNLYLKQRNENDWSKYYFTLEGNEFTFVKWDYPNIPQPTKEDIANLNPNHVWEHNLAYRDYKKKEIYLEITLKPGTYIKDYVLYQFKHEPYVRFLLNELCFQNGCVISPINIYVNNSSVLLQEELIIGNETKLNLLYICIPITKMEKITLPPTNMVTKNTISSLQRSKSANKNEPASQRKVINTILAK